MTLIYIAMGSNLGDREALVLQAVHEMRAFAHIKKISSLIETDAVPVEGQTATDLPGFINAVVEITSDFSPQEVMDELLRIEEEMGRVRGEKGAPREIDLDLIAYGDEVVESSDLVVPHPRMHERRFVLGPLAELNPEWVHPVLKESAQALLEKLPAEE